MSKLLIAGAKGFAKELLEVVLQNDRQTEVSFLDDASDDLPSLLLGRYAIIRDYDHAAEYFLTAGPSFALGVGSPVVRKMFFEKLTSLGGVAVGVVSPHAKIGLIDNQLDNGVCVLTDAVIECGNRLGTGCLVHSGAFISHDVTVGEFCEISPKASLLGNVEVGELCRIGTGAILLPGTKVGNNATVGAGAVVTKNVAAGSTVVGAPARPIR